MADAKILVPTGMLGAGFTAEQLDRGIALGAHAIACDGGSTDSGPAYLGRAMPKMPAEAIAADMRLMMTKGLPAGIPVIVGSAGTSGTDSGVDWVAGIAEQIAAEEGLTIRLAKIYSELSIDEVHRLHAAGSIDPLAPLGPITDELIDRCEHIVGLLGAEPFIDALDAWGERDHRRPGDRHRGDRRRRAAPWLSARPDVARGEDGGVRRPVHEQPARRWRAGRDRRRRVHGRAARVDVGGDPAVGGGAHDLRERQPEHDARAVGHARRVAGDVRGARRPAGAGDRFDVHARAVHEQARRVRDHRLPEPGDRRDP